MTSHASSTATAAPPRHHGFGLHLVAAAAVAFPVLVVLAMLVYPGGDVLNPHHAGYSFFGNVLSDLGSNHAWNGTNNLASHILFASALIAVGAGVLVSLPVWSGYAHARSASLWARALLVVLGTVSATCFVGIALTPADVSPLHATFVNDAFLTLIGFLLSLLVVQWHDPAMKGARWMTVATTMVVILSFVVAVALVGQPGATRYLVGVVSQKVVVSVCVANVYAQARELRKRSWLCRAGNNPVTSGAYATAVANTGEL